tara:strand:- start:236 stop:415 length:180 start_codon:yes stop_codon:yes gene_type:complete
MKYIHLKVTYEWFTPKGRRRTFYDFASGLNQIVAIDNIKKLIKQRIRHENYKVLKMEFN